MRSHPSNGITIVMGHICKFPTHTTEVWQLGEFTLLSNSNHESQHLTHYFYRHTDKIFTVNQCLSEIRLHKQACKVLLLSIDSTDVCFLNTDKVEERQRQKKCHEEPVWGRFLQTCPPYFLNDLRWKMYCSHLNILVFVFFPYNS